VGGQIINTPDIENYPALDLISGPDLAAKMFAQAQKFGAEIKTGQEVNSIEKTETGTFLVRCNGVDFESEAVILAFGKTPRKLDITDSDKYLGRGLSYCATCDGPFFKGKSVAVVGGGNSALDAAGYLSSICEKVYLIHRRDRRDAQRKNISLRVSVPSAVKFNIVKITLCCSVNTTLQRGERETILIPSCNRFSGFQAAGREKPLKRLGNKDAGSEAP